MPFIPIIMSSLKSKYGALALILIVAIGGVYYEISSLNKKIDSLTDENIILEKDIQIKKIEIEMAKENIDRQNEAISTLAIDKNEADIALEEWKNKPADVKYKTLYKTVHVMPEDMRLDRGVCDEGLRLSNSISEMKYEDL